MAVQIQCEGHLRKDRLTFRERRILFTPNRPNQNTEASTEQVRNSKTFRGSVMKIRLILGLQEPDHQIPSSIRSQHPRRLRAKNLRRKTTFQNIQMLALPIPGNQVGINFTFSHLRCRNLNVFVISSKNFHQLVRIINSLDSYEILTHFIFLHKVYRLESK